MNEIEPFFKWEIYYMASDDERSPLFNVEYNTNQYTHDIYGYYIHPMWDYIGSDTLYVKVLYVNYNTGYAILELFGEWNDTLHNDIMHLKRNLLDGMLLNGIHQFILLGENVFNFHGSDDCYYEEWFEEVEDGWIAAINFREFVYDEWKKFNIDSYINFGGALKFDNWRTMNPQNFYMLVKDQIHRRLG
jgi:hypothetical protein